MAKAERVVSDFEVIAGRKSERLSGSLDRPAMPRRGSFSLLQLASACISVGLIGFQKRIKDSERG